MPKFVPDRFDTVPRAAGRVGAHRAENPKMNGWVALLWAVASVLVLTLVGIFIALIMTGRISPFPAETPTPVPTPVETGVVDTTYSVLILNGTPEAGLEARVRDDLINAGWSGQSVFSGTSGATDFEFTTVYYVQASDEPAAIGLAQLVGGAKVVQSDFYADPSDPEKRELTLVLGLDRSSQAPLDGEPEATG